MNTQTDTPRQNVHATINSLAVGASVDFPIERLASVRSLASQLSLTLDRRFSTRTDRARRVITVTRKS